MEYRNSAFMVAYSNRARKYADPALTREVTLRGSLERKFGECSANRVCKLADPAITNPFSSVIFLDRNRYRNRENDLSWVDLDPDPHLLRHLRLRYVDLDLECPELSNPRETPKATLHSTSLCFSNHSSTDLINGFCNHG